MNITFEQIAKNIVRFRNEEERIQALREFRLATGCSLEEAKRFVDAAFLEKKVEALAKNKLSAISDIVDALLGLDDSGYDYQQMDMILKELREVWE